MIKKTMPIFSQIETIFKFSSFHFDGDILIVSKIEFFFFFRVLDHILPMRVVMINLPESSQLHLRDDEGMWMMIINRNIPNSISKRG